MFRFHDDARELSWSQTTSSARGLWICSDQTSSSCGQTKGTMLCYRDFGPQSSTFVKRLVACLLSPTDPSLGIREDNSDSSEVLSHA